MSRLKHLAHGIRLLYFLNRATVSSWRAVRGKVAVVVRSEPRLDDEVEAAAEELVVLDKGADVSGVMVAVLGVVGVPMVSGISMCGDLGWPLDDVSTTRWFFSCAGEGESRGEASLLIELL